MHFKGILPKTTLKQNDSVLGEPIEAVVSRALTSGAPIESNSPPLYQQRSEGVSPFFDIRSDKMELAAEAQDKKTADQLAKRNSLTVVKGATDETNNLSKEQQQA